MSELVVSCASGPLRIQIHHHTNRHTHRHTHTNPQTDRQTHTHPHTDRHTHSHTHTNTHTPTQTNTPTHTHANVTLPWNIVDRSSWADVKKNVMSHDICQEIDNKELIVYSDPLIPRYCAPINLKTKILFIRDAPLFWGFGYQIFEPNLYL